MSIFVHIYVCVYLHTNIYIYIYKHAYIHTNTHIFTCLFMKNKRAKHGVLVFRDIDTQVLQSFFVFQEKNVVEQCMRKYDFIFSKTLYRKL